MKKLKSKSTSRTPAVSTLNLPPPTVAAGPVPAVIDARPLRRAARPRTIRRNGRVASLPKLQRDMVNHMLWNAVPYKNIVAALDEEGFSVPERNVSNWATGGYLEWRLEQEQVLQRSLYHALGMSGTTAILRRARSFPNRPFPRPCRLSPPRHASPTKTASSSTRPGSSAPRPYCRCLN